MASNTPMHISGKDFKKMIAGDKGFLSKKQTDELKSAGFKRLLYSDKVSQDQAEKALTHLQGAGVIPKGKRPYEIYRQAAKEQLAREEMARNEVIKEHARISIKEDLEREADMITRGELDKTIDPRSALGKSLIDEINAEQKEREEKIRLQKEKQDRFTSSKKIDAKKPKLMDLPDLDIG